MLVSAQMRRNSFGMSLSVGLEIGRSKKPHQGRPGSTAAVSLSLGRSPHFINTSIHRWTDAGKICKGYCSEQVIALWIFGLNSSLKPTHNAPKLSQIGRLPKKQATAHHAVTCIIDFRSFHFLFPPKNPRKT